MMMKNLNRKQSWGVVISGVILAGLLAGCGSQGTSASASTNSSTTASASNQSQSNQNQQGRHGNMQRFQQGLEKRLESAGASQTDAQALEKLIQTTHTDPKWVMDQLKNKTSVSTITSDINSGKAPKMQFNGNHRQHSENSSQGSNGDSSSGASTTTNN